MSAVALLHANAGVLFVPFELHLHSMSVGQMYSCLFLFFRLLLSVFKYHFDQASRGIMGDFQMTIPDAPEVLHLRTCIANVCCVCLGDLMGFSNTDMCTLCINSSWLISGWHDNDVRSMLVNVSPQMGKNRRTFCCCVNWLGWDHKSRTVCWFPFILLPFTHGLRANQLRKNMTLPIIQPFCNFLFGSVCLQCSLESKFPNCHPPQSRIITLNSICSRNGHA